MKRWHFFSLTLLVCATLTGCAGDIVSSDPGQELLKDRHLSDDGKFRNGHLLDRALVSSTAGKFNNEQSLQIVFAINKQRMLERYGVVERYAVMERYRVLERYHIVERYEYANVFDGFAITIDDSLGLSAYDDFLAELAQDDEILWYEPDFSVQMPTPSSEAGTSGQMIPWSVAAVGGQTSWAESGDGEGSVDVDVYILDTGVAMADSDDPDDDLALVESIDMRDGDDDARDYDGHGTHIAAIIGAVDDSDGVVGIAPGARLHNIKVLDDNGTTDVSVVIAAVEEITARKLDDPGTPIVVNMSIGENIGTPEYSALDYAIEASTAAGVVYVVAAGNQGDDAANVTPAKVSDAITVGSYNILGFFSSFSNWGPKLDILAPGEGVVSLAPGSSTPVSMSGTSMATAHVTGAAALYLAQHPNASTAEVRDYLVSRAQDFVVGEPASTTTKSLWVGTAGAAPLIGDTPSQDATAVSVQVSDDDDDAEEQDGYMDLGSSDLELVFESSSQQTVGIRFQGVNVPQGATITSASIQFTVDETDDDATNLTLRGEAADNAAAYAGNDYNITSRPTTSASANWAPAPWNSVGEAGSNQKTPDLAALVQEIVSRPGWSSGNAMAFVITGSGERTAESYDGSSSKAPILNLEYVMGAAPAPPAPTLGPPTSGGSLTVAISAPNDDAEEQDGYIDLGSSDLELVFESSSQQTVGLRFRGIDVPQGATITSARIQFTVDETDSGSTNLTLRGEATDDAAAYTSSSHNISNRPTTSASVNWAPAPWNTVGEAGSDQRTPDLTALVQEIVNRPGWTSGNSIAFLITGQGERTAESYEGSASQAAVLHVTW